MSNKHYTCEFCKKEFNQKIDFTRHKNKKAPCITMDKMQKLTQTKEVKTEFKTNLSTIFNYCLDVLRNGEHLTGDKALRTLAHLLDLRLLEPQFGNEINIDDYEYDFSSYEDNIIEKHKEKLLKMVRFSNLVKEKEENIPKIMKCLWDEILSVHPITKNIFLKGKGFDIQYQSTYKKLIDKLYTFDFEAVDEDILGEAYEEVIKDVMTGKVLGQFFTPPKVKQMMIKLIDPQLKADGTIEKIFDPAMGTGGFLISSLRHLLQQSKTKKIKMNWDFISNEGLGGREAEADTYQLAISNMLISSGHMFNVLEKGDSIRNPIINKYDIIFANPPFGIDGLTYNEILHPLRNKYMPIKSNSAVPLFLQAIIDMLKINGRCAVILPDGKELFSKSSELVNIREYLMKTCDLKEIIYLPSGVFTHTSIKTCILYFVKKREGNETLETKIKYSKVNQKETDRQYIFSKTHQTNKVKFYDYNTENEVKHLLLEVEIDSISKKEYSLNYSEYLKDDIEKEQYNDDVVIKILGEVCNIIKGDKKHSKDGKDRGLYPLYYCSILGHLYLDTYTYDGDGIIINKTNGSGKAMIYYGKNKYNVGHTTLHFKSKSNIIITKYIFYYLLHNIPLLEQYFKGANQKSIVEDDLFKIKIPIPTIEKQQEVIKYLDFIYEKANKTSQEKIVELKQLNQYCLNMQKIFGENMVKTLGEVCKVNQGTYIKPDMKIQGEFPVYGGGNVSYYINQYNRENEIIVAKDGVSADCVRYEVKKFFLNHHGWNIICKEQLIKKYMFYYLQLIQPELLSIAKGTAQLGINQENFYKIKIPIPSLERQKEIVEYCEHNDTIIKQLEKDIENNKKQAQMFITSIVKTKLLQEQDETSSVNTEPNIEVEEEVL
jgi:type I restriction enzyme M protein